MKKLLALLFLAVTPLAAQTTTPLTFPTLTDEIAQAGSANTNLTAKLLVWQGTVERNQNDHEIRLKTLESQITQIAVQSDTIGKLQAQITDLQAQVKALTPVVPPPTNAPPAVPVATTIFANSATAGINTGEIMPTPDPTSNGSKVLLAAGRSYVYTQSISAGTYNVTARLSSDPGTTGNMSLHLESPQGVRVSGVIIQACGADALWHDVAASQKLVLSASPLVVVADTVCSGRSYLSLLSLVP